MNSLPEKICEEIAESYPEIVEWIENNIDIALLYYQENFSENPHPDVIKLLLAKNPTNINWPVLDYGNPQAIRLLKLNPSKID